MFDLKREFEEQQNSSEIITYEYGKDTVNDFLLDGEITDFESAIKEINILTVVDAACYNFESSLKDENVNFESALSTFKSDISGTGFSIIDFGLEDTMTSESALLTVESADDASVWKKAWEWVKRKIIIIKNWLVSKWELLTGKASKQSKILEDIEKQIAEIPEGGFSKESALETINKPTKLYFKDVKNIKGAALLADLPDYLSKFNNMPQYSTEMNNFTKSIVDMVKSPKNHKMEDVKNKVLSGLQNLTKNFPDPNISYCNINFGKNTLVPILSEVNTDNRVKFNFIEVVPNSGTSLVSSFRVNTTTGGIIRKFGDNTELKLLYKKDLESISSNLRNIITYYNSSKYETYRKGLISSLKELETSTVINKDDVGLTSSDVRDIVSFLITFNTHILGNTNQILDGVTGMLRVLAIHTKKHYVNQH